MEPLAHRLRPTYFDDMVGQKELIGENGIIRKMVEQNKLMSIILFGPPGCGKTTIAKIIKEKFSIDSFSFNASVDNKKVLQDIANSVKFYHNAIVIIDEIHRMKKDTQDFLLPFLENGSITIIGLTTSNPYISINPAIRSRCHIYQLKQATENDIIELLKKALNDKIFENVKINDSILHLISSRSGGEIRSALNMLETLSLLSGEITLQDAENAIGIKALKLDSKDIYYYDLLSALQKSIRGSDVDAALLYLGRLIKLEDLDIIIRRLTVISYEDIGLANPQVSLYVNGACDAALKLGLPEARIPLSFAVIA
jgi:putative ATPase